MAARSHYSMLRFIARLLLDPWYAICEFGSRKVLAVSGYRLTQALTVDQYSLSAQSASTDESVLWTIAADLPRALVDRGLQPESSFRSACVLSNIRNPSQTQDRNSDSSGVGNHRNVQPLSGGL